MILPRDILKMSPLLSEYTPEPPGPPASYYHMLKNCGTRLTRVSKYRTTEVVGIFAGSLMIAISALELSEGSSQSRGS